MLSGALASWQIGTLLVVGEQYISATAVPLGVSAVFSVGPALARILSSTSNSSDLHKAILSGVVACRLGIPLGRLGDAMQRPSDATPWGVVSVETTGVTPVSIGPGGFDRHEGHLEILIHTTALSGTSAVRAVEDALAEGLRAGRSVSYASTSAMITSFGYAKDELLDGIFRRRVRVTWEAYITRPR
jgi:hypothetical protein